MNQFFYETRGKEKIKELMREGQVSQAIKRARVPKPEVLPSVPKRIRLSKLALILLGALGFLSQRGR
jgi:hypothetical protein